MKIVNPSFRLVLAGLIVAGPIVAGLIVAGLIVAGLIVVGGGNAMAQSTSIITKPFSDYRPRPTVSPYMNLFRDTDTGGGNFDYQTLVRPQLRQQQFNQRQQRTNLLQRRTNLLTQRSSRSQQRSIQRNSQQARSPIPQVALRPTGVGLRGPVGSRYSNTYNYYPRARILGRR